MKPSLFITGAGGFLGAYLLERLDFSAYTSVVCFDRRIETIRLPDPEADNVRCLEGDILEPAGYEADLRPDQIVLHLAAVTGKVSPGQYHRVNADGTEVLLGACRRAGVGRFILISTIAAGFKHTDRYHYALSKIQAERLVRESGLRHTILRPTMIMGPGAPVFKGFAMLAGLPVVPVFGRGEVMLQPIHARDLARAVCLVAESGRCQGEVLELGGPKTICIDDFLRMIARKKGRSPRLLHLPMGLMIWGLTWMERFAYSLVPITVGQLATFRNDGTAADSWLMQALRPEMTGLDQMVAESPEIVKKKQDTVHSRGCRVLTRYLTGQAPSDYVMETYERCLGRVLMVPVTFFDGLLLRLALVHPFFTRTTDTYSRFFCPASSVRRRLAYLAAILEVSPGHFRYYDSTDGCGLTGFVFGLGIRGVTMVLHLLVSLPVLLPLQVLAKLAGGRKKHPKDSLEAS
jgi:nucleoside-diphosphate-sugar epimerase